uniref:Uncharacterized protein n=1 Tax=Arundo donax TaxID=35708 RepID=A0A0A9GW87_ARUDO
MVERQLAIQHPSLVILPPDGSISKVIDGKGITFASCKQQHARTTHHQPRNMMCLTIHDNKI